MLGNRCPFCFNIPVKTWKLIIEYDGSRYRGWQAQKNARSVQETLRRSASQVLDCEVELQGAGRTDAGVHALGQVAHLKVGSDPRISPLSLTQRLNDVLPADIVVLEAVQASPRFHARHHAKSRTYLYRISRRKQAFSKRYVWWVKQALNLEKMRTAAALIPGRHDFKAFRAEDRARPGESTIVVVEHCEVHEESDLILIRITASHFLWRMVRRLVGVLVKVGLDEVAVDDFRDLLHGGNSHAEEVASWTAPSAGLFLEKVVY